jgi:hypothetical protein
MVMAARHSFFGLLFSSSALACSGTGQPEISYAAYATPIAPGPAIEAGDFTISLDEATLAFGPVYFCAAASGSATLCETAVAEITDTFAIDLRSAEPQPLGLVNGFTGEIRSASFDFGIHWFLTESQPVASPVAPGKHSVRFRGHAESASAQIAFVAEIDVLPTLRGQRAVPSVETFANVGERRPELHIEFDAASWIAAIDWEKVEAGAAASNAGGDDAPYRIEIGSPEHNAVVIAMVSKKPPAFLWVDPSLAEDE